MRALLCLFLPHVRLGRTVHEEHGVLRSRCRRCGAPLMKKDDHVWVRDHSRDPGAPQPQPAPAPELEGADRR